MTGSNQSDDAMADDADPAGSNTGGEMDGELPDSEPTDDGSTTDDSSDDAALDDSATDDSSIPDDATTDDNSADDATTDDSSDDAALDDNSTDDGSSDGPVTVPFILGADISFVQEEEDKGIVFTDGGVQKDFVQLLRDRGFNYARLRLFHSPGDPDGYQFEFVTRSEPYCDEAHTIEMAQRVKAAGMGLLLDFHYSDTWADPDDQHKPAAWEGLSFDELRTTVHDYTRDTLLAFEAAGALPDMVQVGNEITPGMLHPDGHTYDPNNWDQLAQLLTAGLSAVKEVDSRIQTMLHIDRGGDNDTTVWWVGEAMNRGVQFDILGQSAYSAFHGGPSEWAANFADIAGRYPELKFVIAEYNGDKRAANDLMRDMPDGRGLGTFFWEPTANGEWGDAMFTWAGNEARADQDDFAIYDQIADDYGLR